MSKRAGLQVGSGGDEPSPKRRRIDEGNGDKDDWRVYHINRFVDRDMMMRFYFGPEVGHVFSHYRTPPVHAAVTRDVQDTFDNT